MMPDKLAVPAEEIRSLINAAASLVVCYYSTLPDRPVLTPSTSHAALRSLHEPTPVEGVGFDKLIQTIDDVIFRHSRHNGHPRFFGYVTSPGAPITAVGSMIESASEMSLKYDLQDGANAAKPP